MSFQCKDTVSQVDCGNTICTTADEKFFVHRQSTQLIWNVILWNFGPFRVKHVLSVIVNKVPYGMKITSKKEIQVFSGSAFAADVVCVITQRLSLNFVFRTNGAFENV